jgi:hypothetical protein
MATTTEQKQVEPQRMATSLRVYLEIESEEQAHGVAERIGDLLLSLATTPRTAWTP